MRPPGGLGGLPNAELATIEERKITRYLLDPGHPDGKSKAKFYLSHGYHPGDWRRLADDLLEHAARWPVDKITPQGFGLVYSVEGPIEMPDGQTREIRSVWIIKHGEVVPLFVTGYYFG